MKIESIESIILSAPYGEQGNLENELHLPHGYRSASFVEITLDDGTTGVGEGYIGVFAPHVFTDIIELYRPYIIGRNPTDNDIIKELEAVSGYWSFSGAARHIISAIDIALWDIKSKKSELPLYLCLNPKAKKAKIQVYGSGGDSISPQYMQFEFDLLNKLGIKIFKIRARNHQIKKTCWCIEKGKISDIAIAVDMAQNLMVPGQTITECITFESQVFNNTGVTPYFIEEPLGPLSLDYLPELRNKIKSKLAGGEIITVPIEMINLIKKGCYSIAQPDASVIGGITAIQEIFAAVKAHDVDIVVHAWGAAPCIMANYHAAFANGCTLAEYPMPAFALRESLFSENLKIKDGYLYPPESIGLGINLSTEIKEKYSFRKEAIYSCQMSEKGKVILKSNESMW